MSKKKSTEALLNVIDNLENLSREVLFWKPLLAFRTLENIPLDL